MHLLYPQRSHFPPLYSIAFCFSLRLRSIACVVVSRLACFLAHGLEQHFTLEFLGLKSFPQTTHAFMSSSIHYNCV